jgi:hypothetical protein
MHPARCGWRCREILDAHLPELAVAVIQPDLEPLVCESLLDNEIGHSVLVHVQGRDCKSRIVRGEGQVAILPGGEMQFNPVHSLTSNHSSIKQQRTVGLLVIVEISGYEVRSE